MKKKPTLAVLFGGNSPEYSVSLQSAYAVLTNLDGEKYHILPLGITQTGRWYLYSGAYEHIATDTWARRWTTSPLWRSPRTRRFTGCWPSSPTRTG